MEPIVRKVERAREKDRPPLCCGLARDLGSCSSRSQTTGVASLLCGPFPAGFHNELQTNGFERAVAGNSRCRRRRRRRLLVVVLVVAAVANRREKEAEIEICTLSS